MQLRSSKLSIPKFLVQESGTYNTMFMRPYEAHLTATVAEQISERYETSASKQVSSTLFAGVANHLLAPSAVPKGEVPISSGWGERRARFILEVHDTDVTGVPSIYFFQGYSNHYDISHSGFISPDMEFTVNSYVRVRRGHIMYNGVAQVVDTVIDSAQVVDNRMRSMSHNDLWLMRPMDIYTGIQSEGLAQAYASRNAGGYDDTRIKLVDESIRSHRRNGVPTNYLSQVLNAHQMGKEISAFGQDNNSVLDASIGQIYEDPVASNPFMRAIAGIRGIPGTCSFRIGDLARIDPGMIPDSVALNPVEKSSLHSTGQTSYWNAPDRETLVATVLANAVPGLLMEALVSQAMITSTNYDSMGVMSTTIRPIRTIVKVDPERALGVVRNRIEREIMFDLTYSNQMSYWMEMDVSIYGETRIKLALNGGPLQEFTTPSFCDSLMTPVVSNDVASYRNVIDTFDGLRNVLNESEAPKTGINLGI